jgi:hypothetical protein
MIQTNELKENEILMIGVSPDGKITSCVFNIKGEKLNEKFILQLSDDEIKYLGEIPTFYFESEPRYLETIKSKNGNIKLTTDISKKDIPKNFSLMSENEFWISRFVLRKLLENEIKQGVLINEQ